MKKCIFLLLFFVSFPTLFYGQYDLESQVPTDPEVKIGKLENGMTYYLRVNKEPKERASFYIIQNVGALLETDEQDGLAHFLEHMAFNGSEHFPGNSLIKNLERHGIAFGRNINAYTSQNETVYNISDVPTTNKPLMDSCLLVLFDWANSLSLLEADIDDERGVISEEWRTGRNSASRMREKVNPVILKGSKYAERNIIGELEVIQNFKHQTIRDFYHDWYRTDLQAIAVVGDFDLQEMEQKVIALFSQIPGVENPKERPFHEIPAHEETYFVVATDPEAQQSAISMYVIHREKNPVKNRHSNLRENLITSLYNSMLNNRISEMLQKGNPPFIYGSVYYGGMVRGYDTYALSVVAKPNEEEAGLRALLTENERVRRFGFTESELERGKTNLLVNQESAVKQKDKRNNDQFARQIGNHYLEQTPLVDIEYYYDFMKSILPGIRVEEVSAKANEWYTKGNRAIAITGPEEDAKHLTEEEALKIIAEVENDKTITAYEDEAVNSDLIEGELPGGKIVAVKQLPEFEAEEWKLSNGATVVFRKADYNKDAVSLSAFSPGGTSLYGVEDLYSAESLSGFTAAYGLGHLDATSLRKALTGKKASSSISLSSLSEGVSGSSTPQDFETMLQLVYLRFQSPRFDKEAHEAYLNRLRPALINASKNPQQVMQDSLRMIMSSYNARTLLMNEAYLDKIDLAKIEEIYRDRFQDASDFTFIIVGNIDAETVKPLVEKYIGSIPATHRQEKWVDNRVLSPEELNKEVGILFETPKSTCYTDFRQNNMEYTPRNNVYLSVLSAILRIKYTENIREKEGGTYGVGVSSNSVRDPRVQYQLTVVFDCDPDKANYLQSLVLKEIDDFRKNGPTRVDLDKVVANMRKEREQSKLHNSYWAGALQTWYRYGYNPADARNYEEILDGISTSGMQEFAEKLFTGAKEVNLIFKPKAE
ncbi:MAG: insulinase family protein [Culturomica sp.]|nr:insulinase family protein [Culturomica sp.]